MNSIMIYLLGVSIRLIAYYMLFRVFYRQLTFHKLNRFVLLLLVLLSFFVLRINNAETANRIINNNEIVSSISHLDDNAQEFVEYSNVMYESKFQWIYLIISVYFVGVLIFLAKTIRNIIELFTIRRHSERQKEGDQIIYYTDIATPFSFFNWIFIPIEQKGKVNKMLLQHEQYHIKYLHTLDLIVVELISILLWFNPVVYFIRKDIREIHEFQVDNEVLNNTDSPTDYLQLILDSVLNKYKKIGLYNYFNGLTIKNRMKMMNKKRNSVLRLMAYIILLPTVFLISVSFVDKSPSDDWTAQVQNQITNPFTSYLDNLIYDMPNDSIPSITPIAKKHYNRTIKFGMRTHPILKTKRLHKGIDFSAKRGTPVKATANGIVTLAKDNKGYGNCIKIKHTEELETQYGHLQKYIVKKGQKVKKGEVIGYVGSTGLSTSPYLHYEVLKNSVPIDPEPFME